MSTPVRENWHALPGGVNGAGPLPGSAFRLGRMLWQLKAAYSFTSLIVSSPWKGVPS
jgi:hypothetical protein